MPLSTINFIPIVANTFIGSGNRSTLKMQN